MKLIGHSRTAGSVQANEPRIAPRAGFVARVSAHVRSHQLDRALAQGAPPETGAALALRARRLTRLSSRRTVADGLRRVVDDASAGTPPSRARISPRPSQVRLANAELSRLADALATAGPVAARGVAEASILLTDGTGPLYNAHSRASVSARAARALDHLRLAE